MASNVNALLDKAEDPEKTINEYIRNASGDLGKVKAETASVLAEERRAKRALDECKAEITKLQAYAEKSVQAGKEADALKFLERKAAQTAKLDQLQAAYDTARASVEGMQRMQDKLTADLGRLEERLAGLKGKMAAAKAQQRLNALGSASGDSALDALEEKVNKAYDEAMAVAELRAGAKDDFDDLFAQFEKSAGKSASPTPSTNLSPEDELRAMKERMNTKP